MPESPPILSRFPDVPGQPTFMDRIFVEKKPEFNSESGPLLHDLQTSLHLDGLESLRTVQRYDVEGLSAEEFDAASRLILSEPQVDAVSATLALADDERAFAVEYLPGQFDQRADSAAQCVQILTGGQRPLIAAAKVIVLKGAISDADLACIKEYTINTVDSREASMDRPASLALEASRPGDVTILEGFNQHDDASLGDLRSELGLAMSLADLVFCQSYFRDQEQRDPSITEIRMLDTYWSDHCRHTTFLTRIENVTFDEGTEHIRESYETYLTTRESVYGDEDRPVTPDGHCPDGDEGTAQVQRTRQPGSVSRDQCRQHCSTGGCRRRTAGVARHVQERDPQPPDRDRALRRSSHLPRRRDPRSPLWTLVSSTRPCA